MTDAAAVETQDTSLFPGWTKAASAFIVGALGSLGAVVGIADYWDRANPKLVTEAYHVRYEAEPNAEEDTGLGPRSIIGALPRHSPARDYFRISIRNDGRKAAQDVTLEIGGVGLAVIERPGEGTTQTVFGGADGEYITIGRLDALKGVVVKAWRSDPPDVSSVLLRHQEDIQAVALTQPGDKGWLASFAPLTISCLFMVIIAIAAEGHMRRSFNKRMNDYAVKRSGELDRLEQRVNRVFAAIGPRD